MADLKDETYIYMSCKIGDVCTRVGQKLALAPRPLRIYCASSKTGDFLWLGMYDVWLHVCVMPSYDVMVFTYSDMWQLCARNCNSWKKKKFCCLNGERKEWDKDMIERRSGIKGCGMKVRKKKKSLLISKEPFNYFYILSKRRPIHAADFPKFVGTVGD
jgi:hypothetical protein